MAFREIGPRYHKFWLSVEFLEGIRAKNLDTAILFVNFSKAFESIYREKMEQIQLTYGLPKETVAAIMMLYKNTSVNVHSPNEDTDNFDIVADVLQEHINPKPVYHLPRVRA